MMKIPKAPKRCEKCSRLPNICQCPVGWRTAQRYTGLPKRTKRAVYGRARGVCEQAGCQAPGTEYDHITPRAEGGTDHFTNIQLLCSPHHKAKSIQERIRGIKRRFGK